MSNVACKHGNIEKRDTSTKSTPSSMPEDKLLIMSFLFDSYQDIPDADFL